MVISNCAITLSDAEVIRPCVMSKDSSIFKKTKQYHTGLDIVAENLVAAYRGRIVYIGNETSGRTVVLQTGSSFCVCYKHLKTVTVNLNDLLEKYYVVGIADKYVHVEVYTKDKSIWPVRIGNDTWYKQDANLLFNGGLDRLDMYAYQQEYNFDVEEDISDLSDMIMSNSGGE